MLEDTIQGFEQYLKDGGVSAGTIHDYMSVAKHYINFINKKPFQKTITATLTAPKPADDPFPYLKIGELVNTKVRERLAKGILEEELKNLQKKDYCSYHLNISYPLLVTRRTYQNSHFYYAEPVMINDRQFYICSQWFESNVNNDRPYVLRWLHGHKKQTTSTPKVILHKRNNYTLVAEGDSK